MSTYQQLREDAQQWTLRNDIVEQIPQLLTLAQARIDREVRVLAMGSSAQLVFDGKEAILPGDYLAMLAIAVADEEASSMTYVTPDRFFKDPMYFNRGGTWSDSRIYTIFGQQLYIAPSPERDVTIYYYARLAPLTRDDSTNWVLQNAYDLYLQALVAEIYAFTRNEEEEIAARARFDTAVQSLHETDQRASMSGSSLQATGNPYGIV